MRKKNFKCKQSLHQAMKRKRRWVCVKDFIKSKADVNVVDELKPIISHLIRLAHFDTYSTILDHEDIIQKLVDGLRKTPLLLLISLYAPTYVIKDLITTDIVNQQHKDGLTALHQAVTMKRWDLVPILIHYGADVNAVCDWDDNDIISMYYDHRENKTVYTPLFDAIRNVPEHIVTQLISPQNINMQLADGETALHSAVSYSRWKIVKILLDYGADVHLTTDRGKTPLHYAVGGFLHTPEDIIRKLITPQNINMQDANGDTVLHNAVSINSWEVVQILLEHGADINLFAADNSTPLHLACVHGKYGNNPPKDMITQLISAQNINMMNEFDKTALQIAAERELHSSVEVLVQHGADPTTEPGFQPEVSQSLQDLCIATIRKHMPVKTDAAFAELKLPTCLMIEVKMKGLAQQFVSWWEKRRVKILKAMTEDEEWWQ